jgi:hypothetical protein
VTALADAPPVVGAVLPRVAIASGPPLHLTVTGANLSHTVSVSLAPAVPGLSFAVANDQTLLVTVPASVAADTYSLLVTTPGGTSDPASAPSFTVSPPLATSTASAPPLPQYSFAPTPTEGPAPGATVMHPALPVAHAAGPAQPAVTPAGSRGGAPNTVLLLCLGVVLGALGYLLWGRPGRLATASRQDLAAQLVARPAQALRIGRICLQCGRLHLVVATRRDLWRAGQFCSATCFVAAQEEDAAAREAETEAEARMRRMFLSPDLDRSIEKALAADRSDVGDRDGAKPAAAPALAGD